MAVAVGMAVTFGPIVASGLIVEPGVAVALDMTRGYRRTDIASE